MYRTDTIKRILNPEAILVPLGYKIEVFAENFTTPINLTFTDRWEMLIADAGIASENGKVLMLTPTETKVIADGLIPVLLFTKVISMLHTGNLFLVPMENVF